MELKEGQLRVYRNLDSELGEKVDAAIADALRPFGIKQWASGYNLETGVRDLALEDRN